MNARSLLTLMTIGLLLTACGKTENPVSSQVNGDATSQHSHSESEESRTQPSYNGDYYFVEGKYGTIPIVNKKYPVAARYAPGEDSEALEAFLRLKSDMQAQGFAIADTYSGFRSYETQDELYRNYVSQHGQAEADTFSARPGHSEHQTGLAFDLIDADGQLLEEPKAAAWLAKHAHEYGFIVRYQKGKEAITGYQAESWHIRFIGGEASEIYKSGLTLEEYFSIPGGDYAE